MFRKNNLIFSFTLCFFVIALTAKNSQALIIDNFFDDTVQLSVNTNTGPAESWGVSPLDNVLGGCRYVKISCPDSDPAKCVSGVNESTGNFDNVNGNYAHNQDLNVRALTTMEWGACQEGDPMKPLDLTLDGSQYVLIKKAGTIVAGGSICLSLTDNENNNGRKCITTDENTLVYKFLLSYFATSAGGRVDLTKIKKINLTIDGGDTDNFNFGVSLVSTGADSPITVCNVVPSPSNNYGKKDTCGYCLGDVDYGKGPDECTFCPNDVLPNNYQYGDGKICNKWCPTVANPGKKAGKDYTCYQCDDGFDNDNKGDIDCLDPQCLDENNICDPNDDNEFPECSDNADNDGDLKVDCDDTACLDGNGVCDPNLDNEGAECSDGIDNDGDGYTDKKDPSCWVKNSSTGQYEYKPSKDNENDNTECSDGSDNDADNYIDSADPGCWYEDSTKLGGSVDYSSKSPFFYWNPWDTSETFGWKKYQCSDGIDNDGDKDIDAKDSGCLDSNGNWNPKDDSENNKVPECSDGIDNDGDGKTDYPDDSGCSSSKDDSEKTLPECSDGIDNDGDGKIDAEDYECWVTPASGNPYYDPDGLTESGCTSSTGVTDLGVNNERLAAIGLNAALYLKKFYANSSSAYKRTTLSAKRAGEAIKKEIDAVSTALSTFDVACSSSGDCRNNNDSELKAFAKKVNALNKIVRRAQRRGLFFKKNYESKAITKKKQNRIGYKTAKTNMLNNRSARTRTKVYINLNSKVTYIGSLAVCS